MTADPVKEWVLYWYEKLQIEAWAGSKNPVPNPCQVTRLSKIKGEPSGTLLALNRSRATSAIRSLTEVKPTSRGHRVSAAIDLGCVKTQKIEKCRELFFSDQAKATLLRTAAPPIAIQRNVHSVEAARRYVFIQPRPISDVGTRSTNDLGSLIPMGAVVPAPSLSPGPF